ncbi:hypothetical protein Droror1_Dr00023416 [Drosera rotundifolia]
MQDTKQINNIYLLPPLGDAAATAFVAGRMLPPPPSPLGDLPSLPSSPGDDAAAAFVIGREGNERRNAAAAVRGREGISSVPFWSLNSFQL